MVTLLVNRVWRANSSLNKWLHCNTFHGISSIVSSVCYTVRFSKNLQCTTIACHTHNFVSLLFWCVLSMFLAFYRRVCTRSVWCLDRNRAKKKALGKEKLYHANVQPNWLHRFAVKYFIVFFLLFSSQTNDFTLLQSIFQWTVFHLSYANTRSCFFLLVPLIIYLHNFFFACLFLYSIIFSFSAVR